MHRSSESVAALAGALARAQAELVNPEKSLVGIVGSERRGEVERSFRYAPLSSGLDIVRKTLSKHEIAAIQTTAIDAATGTVHLTTMLAHASGEWIASDWPVCAVADTATPRRMGAALTYARRYGLFTLVGIAGEDDVDAQDLQDGASMQRISGADLAAVTIRAGQLNLYATGDGHRAQSRRNAKANGSRKPILPPDQSAELTKQLVGEIADLGSTQEATIWAHRILGAKNRATAADAQLIEAAFQSRIATLDASENQRESTPVALPLTGTNIQTTTELAETRTDNSALKLAEPRRYRSKAHLKFVSAQSCLVCGRLPSDPHHLRFMQRRALGRKVSDEFTVPLCRGHHREVHRCRDEAAWWLRLNIDPAEIARRLWEQTQQIIPDLSVQNNAQK